MADQKIYKKTYKSAACTKPAWEHLVPKDHKIAILHKIREESILLHGRDLNECPKRKTCFTKTCMGRPLPVNSPTFQPYLEQLKQTHTVVNNELFIDNCGTCSISSTCNMLCYQMNDYLQRDSDPQPNLIYQENLENYDTASSYNDIDRPKDPTLTLCWDILPENKAKIIKKYLYEQKDFEVLSKELGIKSKADAKYTYYYALTKLAEYSVVRQFLKNNQDKLTENQLNIMNLVYYGNKSLTSVAKEFKISVEAVRRTVERVIVANKLTWPIFVTRKGTERIYNIPEVLK